jgi:hypothetical protein
MAFGIAPGDPAQGLWQRREAPHGWQWCKHHMHDAASVAQPRDQPFTRRDRMLRRHLLDHIVDAADDHRDVGRCRARLLEQSKHLLRGEPAAGQQPPVDPVVRRQGRDQLTGQRIGLLGDTDTGGR